MMNIPLSAYITILLIHSSMEEQTDHFQALANVNKINKNIHAQDFVETSFVKPLSTIGGLYDKRM